MARKIFRWRAFASLFLALMFLLSAVSGILLFLRPEGSLAAWTGWSALGLDKKGWEALHAVSIFFFLICAVVHLANNWRALLAYCRRRQEQTAAGGRFRELAAALVLTGLLLAGTLRQWPPLRWLVDWRGIFKSGTTIMEIAPPAANAEKLTLAGLCPLLGVEENELLDTASRQDLSVESLEQTLAEVAVRNGVSPEEVYLRLGGK